MKLCFILFFYLAFIVTAKKHKHRQRSEESLEYVTFEDGYFDLRGEVRRYFYLYAALVDDARSFVCSPWSVMMPLGKLALGAEGDALDDLLKAIGLKSKKQIAPAFAQLITNMEYLPGVKLDVASKLFITTQKSIKKSFLKNTKDIFKACCERLESDSKRERAQIINDWVRKAKEVADKTRNKIKRLVTPDDVKGDDAVILVNAIYFSGKWKYEFRTGRKEIFNGLGGLEQDLPMMTTQGQYKYWKCNVLRAELVEIPYEGSQSSMVIVLPFSRNGVPLLLHSFLLDAQLLNDALEKMKIADLHITMPKFRIETQLDMNTLYKDLGLGSLFKNRHSELTGIIEDEEIHITRAIHKAIIDVNEEGTEAAAATGVVVEQLSAFLGQRLKVNRPFMFYIKAYQEQLFSGAFYGK